jgi:hypothetical protein
MHTNKSQISDLDRARIRPTPPSYDLCPICVVARFALHCCVTYCGVQPGIWDELVVVLCVTCQICLSVDLAVGK